MNYESIAKELTDAVRFGPDRIREIIERHADAQDACDMANAADMADLRAGAVEASNKLDRVMGLLGRLRPITEWAIEQMESEVDWEYSHTEAQKSICTSLEEYRLLLKEIDSATNQNPDKPKERTDWEAEANRLQSCCDRLVNENVKLNDRNSYLEGQINLLSEIADEVTTPHE